MERNDSRDVLEILALGMSFDAVVLDLNSTPLDAKQIIRGLRAISQTLPVLITTGGDGANDPFFNNIRTGG